jgi:hypothetical protein
MDMGIQSHQAKKEEAAISTARVREFWILEV